MSSHIQDEGTCMAYHQYERLSGFGARRRTEKPPHIDRRHVPEVRGTAGNGFEYLLVSCKTYDIRSRSMGICPRRHRVWSAPPFGRRTQTLCGMFYRHAAFS